MTVNEILQKIRLLAEADRSELFSRLREEDFSNEDSESHSAEILKLAMERLAEYDAGKVETSSVEECMQRVRANLHERIKSRQATSNHQGS